MNAVSHAITLELTSKIAHLAILFRAEFPNATVDLSPWLTDQGTQSYLDPNSIDLSFFFPKRNIGLECQCVLMLVHFSEELLLPTCQLSTIEASGFDQQQQQWQFSTADGEFTGLILPSREHQCRFKHLVNRIFELFQCPNRVNIPPN